MNYLSEDTATIVANALNEIIVENAIDVFRGQILEDDGDYSGVPIDHLSPILALNKKIVALEGVDEDHLREFKSRIYDISSYIISAISSKFNIDIDEEWIADGDRSVVVALVLYRFFIIELFYNIMGIISAYINKYKMDLYDIYKENPTSFDVTTQANNKKYGPEDAVIITNIYEVTDYIFTIIDTEVVFDLLPNSATAAVIKAMYEGMHAMGDFVHVIASIYNESVPLRSKITFEIIYNIHEANKKEK